MVRIESVALQIAESKGAAEIIEASTENLIAGQIRFARHVIIRKGGDGANFKVSEAQREKLRQGVNRQATLNSQE